jgi:hypothetical protein
MNQNLYLLENYTLSVPNVNTPFTELYLYCFYPFSMESQPFFFGKTKFPLSRCLV